MEFVEFDEVVENVKTISLLKDQEWTVQIPAGTSVTITIKYGIAEILGTELANEVPYTFQGLSVNILAVERCMIEWKSLEEVEGQVSENKAYHRYIYNLHFSLERLRLSSFNGPRLLILGNGSSGKSSLAHILCSYALKVRQYQPVMVNLNPQDGIFSIPGSVTATPISELLDVESSMWGQSITTGATKLHSKQPLVKNFGLENINDNKPLYLSTIARLAAGVEQRLKNDPIVRRSGIIVDTPKLDYFDSESWSEVLYIIEQFGINAVVICAEGDELAISLDEVLKNKMISIMRIPSPESVVKIDDITRRSIQRLQIREYFYGVSDTVLSPYTMGAGFEELTVFKPRNSTEFNESDSEVDLMRFDPVEVNAANLQHAILAITNLSRKDSPDKIAASSIMGYALVSEVNDPKRKLRILLPVPSRIPDRIMVLTEYRYLE